MTGPDSPEEPLVRRMKGESQLTAQLIAAASEANGPLSQEEVDEILDVHPGGET